MHGLPSLASLPIGAGPPRPVRTMQPDKAREFVKKVNETLQEVKGRSFQVPKDMQDQVVKYLANTFTPDMANLGDQSKNKVLWTTAMFIENVLTDWGLSGGFWSNDHTVRFANNDVQNLVERRDQAFEVFDRTLKRINKKKVAFLYVVAKELGFTTSKSGPQLLLMGHKQPNNAFRHWGIPGGLRDDTDPNPLFNAMRELGEELLGMKRPKKTAIDSLVTRALQVGSLQQLQQSDDKSYTAYVLIVNTALEFEVAFGLPKRTTVEKYQKDLSKETQGYVWQDLPLRTQKNKGGDWVVQASAPGLNNRELLLRRGVYGPSTEIRKRV
jgi:hypothetical protein